MVFKTVQEGKIWFRNYKPTVEKVPCFWTEYEHPIWRMGDWILFQHITNETISRPIFGLFVEFTVWDQALVLSFIEQRRAWQLHHYRKPHDDKEWTWQIATYDMEVEYIQFWTDNIKVLGHWKHKPSKGELKAAAQCRIELPKVQECDTTGSPSMDEPMAQKGASHHKGGKE